MQGQRLQRQAPAAAPPRRSPAREVPAPAAAARAPTFRIGALAIRDPAPAQAGQAAAPRLTPLAPTAGAPMQLQTPWWKKALIGAGLLGGAAAFATGVALSSPALAVGGAVAAAGGAYGAWREHQKSKIRLSIRPDIDTRNEMHAAMGTDPNVSFHPDRIESRYDAQQMMEQYPSPYWQAPMSSLIDQGGGARQVAENAGLRHKIDASFAPSGVFERSEAEKTDRINRARTQTNTFDYAGHDLRRDGTVIGGDRNALAVADAPTALQQILARHPGVSLGEGHGDPTTKTFLANHLPTLAASGVNTLYMEHFRSDHQAHLDRYHASGMMPPELDRYITNQDNRHNAGQQRLRTLVTGARGRGMRVRAIDSQSAASPEGSGEGGKTIREAAMNHVAHQVITGDTGRGVGKYAILTGAAHNNTQPLTAYGGQQGFLGGPPGLSQLLEIPAVTIDGHGMPVLDEEGRHNR